MTQQIVSQDYFDQICIENAELNDDEDDTDLALRETMEQLHVTPANAPHLVLSFPTENDDERKSRRDFEGLIKSEESVHKVYNILCQNNNAAYTTLFRINNGIPKYLDMLRIDSSDDCVSIVLDTLLFILRSNKLDEHFLRDLQKSFNEKVVANLLQLMNNDTKNNNDNDYLQQLFSLAYWSCRKCEDNKLLWINTKAVHDASNIDLVNIMQSMTITTDLCKLIVVLCTFDDFGNAVSSSHSNAQALASMIGPLTSSLMKDEKDDDLVSTINALRALAINSDNVKRIQNSGVLEKLREIFQQNVNNELIVAALVGLYRNLTANDDLKVTLCRQDETSIYPLLLQVATDYPNSATLQENFCAVIASMALRQPQNCQYMLQLGGDANSNTSFIVLNLIATAMYTHTDKVVLQRQAALAIRNLTSRLEQAQKTLLLQNTSIENALQNIAAKHLACQDEVYAALRDLGLEPPLMMRVEKDGDTIVNYETTQMFGQVKSNFRAVYDESRV